MKTTKITTTAITLLALSLTAVVSIVIAETPANSAAQSKANASTSDQESAPENPQIDYRKFIELASENEKVRQAHRVKVTRFVSMAAEPGTIILDTRSKSAFDEVHVRGAVHLNFSDFTDEKLTKVIPNKSTRILIYCNNNFLPNKLKSLMLKRVELALNIPTFVNLRGYGYENVFELADVVALDNPHLKLAGTEVKKTASNSEER